MKVKPNNSKGVEEEQQVIPLSQYYPPGMSTTNHLPEGTKSRRRRKKGRGGESAGGGSEGMKKRKLTAEQMSFLEMNFGTEHKLESARKDRLAAELGLDPRQVAVWFQNRRARWRSKQMEQDYSRLKTTHESLVLEKCRLEAEVCTLKEQLVGAKKEIRSLSERSEIASDVGRHCSPSTSFSTRDTYDPFLRGFGGLDEDDSLMFFTGYDYYVNAMDWLNWNGI